ncbi:amidohydrolase, partial [candidate division WOR-3 bacterium]|nr:amidohydrolase [candidate division WOR-3 bacterium]
LAGLGIEHHRAAGTGVIATVGGARPGACIALRCDMDALRIAEPETTLNRDYRSQRDGLMHACGHDGHMAIVLGAARWLQEHRDHFAGSVRLIFQPAEESPPGGAHLVVRDGGLDGVRAIVGLHLLGTSPLGLFTYRPGPFMAHTRSFRVRVIGRPGHHMCPQDNVDPILIAGQFTAVLQGNIRQALAPDETWVLGFGSIHGGSQFNQTPDAVEVIGSFRAFSPAAADRIELVMRQTLEGLMAAFRLSAEEPRFELEFVRGYPVLRNHPAFTARLTTVLRGAGLAVEPDAPANLGGEDFALYLEHVPGVFAFLGAANPARGISHINHSNLFDIDEAALTLGARALATIALDFLADPAPYLTG